MRTKTFLLKTSEFFDWKSEDGACAITFRVTEMLEAAAAQALEYELVQAPLDREWATIWLPQRDINVPYALSLGPDRYNIPLLGVAMPDETMLLIDGSHRYFRRFHLKLTHFKVRIIPLGKWEPYATIRGTLPAAPPAAEPS